MPSADRLHGAGWQSLQETTSGTRNHVCTGLQQPRLHPAAPGAGLRAGRPDVSSSISHTPCFVPLLPRPRGKELEGTALKPTAPFPEPDQAALTPHPAKQDNAECADKGHTPPQKDSWTATGKCLCFCRTHYLWSQKPGRKVHPLRSVAAAGATHGALLARTPRCREPSLRSFHPPSENEANS